MFRIPVRRAALACAFLIAGLASIPAARADVFVLKDGTEVDGQVIREADGFIYVKTITAKVLKLSHTEISERREGVSAIEKATELETALKKDGKDVPTLWQLFEVLAPFDDKDVVKRRTKVLEQILKLDPNHAAARKAHGDVEFEGEWVPEADLPRAKAEFARKKLKREWSSKLELDVDVYETEHFVFVDGYGAKDLVGHADVMEKAYAALADVLQREKLWNDRCAVITVKGEGAYNRILDEYQKTWQMKEWWTKAAKANTGVWRQSPNPVILRHTGKSEDYMWSAIVHSTAHLAMWTMYKRNVPAWLEEGLGAWVELEATDEHVTSCVGDTTVKKGDTTDKRPNKKGKGGSVQDEFDMWREVFVEKLSGNDFDALRLFLRRDLGEFQTEHEGAAQALVTYLIGKGPEKFAELVSGLQGMDMAKSDPVWKRVLGFDTVEDLETDWKGWVLSQW